MARLTSKTQLGGALGDTFQGEKIVRVFADGVYGFAEVEHAPIVFPLSGQFLCDPNEINGWGSLGPYDNTNSQDLGNSTPQPANLNRLAGGICFPFDVELTAFYANHRDSTNATAAVEPWGWVLARQVKSPPGNTVTTTYILDEVTANAGVGPRAYGNNQNQRTDLTFTGQVIPANETIVLAVSSPTANTTNRYVQVMSGYLLLERV